MKSPKNSFSVRHPFLFGFSLLLMAVALIWGAAAFFHGKTGLFSSEKLGIVNVQGTITNSLPTVKFLRDLRRDDSVKGVLLRINSPGGTIAPSQELYHAVKSFAEVKPIVASFGTVAASGGYYAAAPATKILASAGSITGSIGVKAEYANFRQLMDKLGVRPIVITSGNLKGAGSPYSELTEEQRIYLKGLIMDIHNQFVDDVAKARKLERKAVEKIADGRAVTGREAKELGLVDRIGGYEDSITVLKALCGLEGDVPVLEGPEEEKPLIREILGYFGLEPQGSVAGDGLIFLFDLLAQRSGDMKCTFIGVGSAFDAGCVNTSILIESGGKSVLLDCGFNSAHSFVKHAEHPLELDILWISHFHGDHFFGIPFLIGYYFSAGRQKDFQICGPRGLKEKVLGLVTLAYSNILSKLSFRLVFTEFEPGEKATLAEIGISTANVDHSQPALAVRIEHEGAAVFYTGDGEPGIECVDLAHGADLGVFEAYQLEEQVKGHSNVEKCLNFMSLVEIKLVALVHLEPFVRTCKKKEIMDLLAESRLGKVILPEDGQAVLLT